jgi:acyl homoserine lactone synthase
MEDREMFITIEAPQRERFASLLDQMFRLRKTIFHDQLKWEVPVCGPYERDPYDDLDAAYLVWCSADGKNLYGSARLMPTTGPTLLYDVFFDTLPHAAPLQAPGIWEVTRLCLHDQNIARDHAGIDSSRAIGLMCLALAECAVSHNIHTLICNYEPHMARVYKRTGCPVQELGRADGYGRRPVCCGAFYMSPETVTAMRQAQKVDLPLYQLQLSDRLMRSKALAA